MPESKSGALPLGDSPAETCKAHLHANIASGCRESVRATHPPVCCGRSVNAPRASRSVGKAANTHAPDPVIRGATDARDIASIVAATAGKLDGVTGARAVLP